MALLCWDITLLCHFPVSTTAIPAAPAVNNSTTPAEDEDAWWLKDEIPKPKTTSTSPIDIGTDPPATTTQAPTTTPKKILMNIDAAAVVTCRWWLVVTLLPIVKALSA